MSERYGRLVARARLLGVPAHQAPDVVQEALVRTFARRRGFASLAQAEQYVRRAIVTVWFDESGRAVRERARWDRAASGGPTVVADHATQVIASADVAAALAHLAPRERACVVLRYLDDVSIHETADLLGLTDGAVKRYVSDGLARLNAALGTAAVPSDDDVPVVPVEGGAR